MQTVCNKCRQSFEHTGDMQVNFEHASTYDMETWEFRICDDCIQGSNDVKGLLYDRYNKVISSPSIIKLPLPIPISIYIGLLLLNKVFHLPLYKLGSLIKYFPFNIFSLAPLIFFNLITHHIYNYNIFRNKNLLINNIFLSYAL